LIGWGLQRVTSLRPAVAAKVLLLWNALRGLIRYISIDSPVAASSAAAAMAAKIMV